MKKTWAARWLSYRLNSANEELHGARAELAALEGILKRIIPTVGYLDAMIKAKERVAILEYRVKTLTAKEPS